MGTRGMVQIYVHPNSCNMEEVIVSVQCQNGHISGQQDTEHISCSLSSRQSATSSLIRSVCSVRAHVCGLWTSERARSLPHRAANTACSPDGSLRAETVQEGGGGSGTSPVSVSCRFF